ncbi:uncharacterized protein [Hetaerina americana]|uniref:uncharacterized protein n=1 Tax=Hetaerina americana TaxID=62018 RepID=UPI003A7F5669
MSDTLSLKLLKVDNWGIFFLQRLQESFAKSNFCDLTLKFSGEAKLKVHRLVLNTCTEYFLGLEKLGNHEPNCLQMPNELHPDVVLPIINFMYTGRLEFKEELQNQLYSTAKEMKMTILTRLLDAQSVPVPPVTKPQNKRVPPPITYNLQGKKVVPKMVDPDLPEMLPGRKLPIWKRRSAPPTLPAVNEAAHVEEFECNSREEPPRPTRFEWPEEEEGEELGFSGAFDSISYDSKPLQRPKETPGIQQPRTSTPIPASSPAKPTVSFEELRKTVIHKRPANQSPSEGPDAKKGKVVDIQEVKEYLQEQELRKNLVDNEEEGGTEDDDFDDSVPVADLDDEEEEDKDITPVEESMTVTENVSHVEVVEPIPSPSCPSESGSSMLETSPGHPQKSILKSRVSRDMPDTPSKRVRFTLEAESPEGKENTTDVSVKEEPKEVSKILSQTECSISCSSTKPNNLSNHAKIISEVLKKYPNLVKDNKNIKLKIMQRGGHAKPTVAPVEGDSGKVVRSKVSYVVVKSNDASKGKVVLKRGALSEPLSEFVNPEGQKPPSGAENTTGPWLCHSCGTNEEPINFETYYSYRKHLQDVHMEKIDARICEHCGHKASKRNLLLYHLYTRHGVPPPRNCQFPKCDQCDYVALSESLLIKHRNNHSNSRDFVCKVCNASFKSNGALQGHIQANLHGDPTKKKYECPYCRKPFVRNINLKAHIRSSHKEIARQLDGEDENLPDGKKKKTRPRILESGSTVLHIQGSGTSSEEGSHQEHTVLVLQSGEKVIATSGMLQAPTLVPSSEAEALSNVASGIAASLGLNDTMTDVTDNGNPSHRQENAGNSCSAFVIHDVSHSVHEYILPDIISGDLEVAQSYTGQLAELDHYGGEEAATCALDSNTGQLTAVTTANGTTLMDIAKQIPVLLADPNSQLHGNDISGQRLTLVKDGVTIGVLVSQPSPTMGSNVISRADGETSSSMPVGIGASLPKLEKEITHNESGLTSEQAASYDGMPPILMREVPLDATSPSGTSTVVLVTLPSSEMGMPLAMREADFDEAVKCFVLTQDGTGMTAAPQITLMNAIPQEEAPRETPEKTMGSTGKIGRIGILKKKSDPSRAVRSTPTTTHMVSGAFSADRGSVVPHQQQIGFLLPVDTVQKTTGILSQQSQPHQINMVLSTDGSGGEVTLVQTSSDPAPPQAKLVHQSHMPIKAINHADEAAKSPDIVPLAPVAPVIPSESVQAMVEVSPLENKTLCPSTSVSDVAVSHDNTTAEAGNMAISLGSSNGCSSDGNSSINSANSHVPSTSNMSEKPSEEKIFSQKILAPVDIPSHEEGVDNKLMILSENIVMQNVSPKMDASLSNTDKFAQGCTSEIPNVIRQCVNPIIAVHNESKDGMPSDGVIEPAREAVSEGGNIHVMGALQDKSYVEVGALSATNLISVAENVHLQQPEPIEAPSVVQPGSTSVSVSGVGLSVVAGLAEIPGEGHLGKEQPKDFARESKASLLTMGVPSNTCMEVPAEPSTSSLSMAETHQDATPVLSSCTNIPVAKSRGIDQQNNTSTVTIELANATVSEGEILKSNICENNDKVT